MLSQTEPTTTSTPTGAGSKVEPLFHFPEDATQQLQTLNEQTDDWLERGPEFAGSLQEMKQALAAANEEGFAPLNAGAGDFLSTLQDFDAADIAGAFSQGLISPDAALEAFESIGLGASEAQAMLQMVADSGGDIDQVLAALAGGKSIEEIQEAIADWYKTSEPQLNDMSGEAGGLRDNLQNIPRKISSDVDVSIKVRGNASIKDLLALGIPLGQAKAIFSEQAQGGPLADLALVGEEGPELIINGIVVPAQETRKLMALGLLPKRRYAIGGPLGGAGDSCHPLWSRISTRSTSNSAPPCGAEDGRQTSGRGRGSWEAARRAPLGAAAQRWRRAVSRSWWRLRWPARCPPRRWWPRRRPRRWPRRRLPRPTPKYRVRWAATSRSAMTACWGASTNSSWKRGA